MTALAERFAELRVKMERGEPIDWPKWEERAKKELEDELAAVFILIFLMMREDQTRASQLASAFVSRRVGSLITRMRGNFRNEINSGVPVQDVFSPSRAETIAITEVTTAISAAENAARQESAADDPAERARGDFETPGTPVQPPVIVNDGTIAIWQTQEDERVCPVCGPLHDRRADSWASQFPEGPPAHPRCRCFLIYKAL